MTSSTARSIPRMDALAAASLPRTGACAFGASAEASCRACAPSFVRACVRAWTTLLRGCNATRCCAVATLCCTALLQCVAATRCCAVATCCCTALLRRVAPQCAAVARLPRSSNVSGAFMLSTRSMYACGTARTREAAPPRHATRAARRGATVAALLLQSRVRLQRKRTGAPRSRTRRRASVGGENAVAGVRRALQRRVHDVERVEVEQRHRRVVRSDRRERPVARRRGRARAHAWARAHTCGLPCLRLKRLSS